MYELYTYIRLDLIRKCTRTSQNRKAEVALPNLLETAKLTTVRTGGAGPLVRPLKIDEVALGTPGCHSSTNTPTLLSFDNQHVY